MHSFANVSIHALRSDYTYRRWCKLATQFRPPRLSLAYLPLGRLTFSVRSRLSRTMENRLFHHDTPKSRNENGERAGIEGSGRARIRDTWKRARYGEKERGGSSVVGCARLRGKGMAGFVVRDNSLSVAEAAASGNGVTTLYEAQVPAARPRGGRLKRVCIPDEDRIRLARKQPIHRTLFSFDFPAIYTTDYVPTARPSPANYSTDSRLANYFLLSFPARCRLAAFTRSRCGRNQLFYRSFSVTLEDTGATLRCSLRWLFVPPPPSLS